MSMFELPESANTPTRWQESITHWLILSLSYFFRFNDVVTFRSLLHLKSHLAKAHDLPLHTYKHISFDNCATLSLNLKLKRIL